jgi:ATP-dependent DNA helicase RecG
MKENQIIEWKQSWRDEYLKWICGFANAQGGTLVIGKNDKGEVTGVANAAKLLEDIPNKARDILGMVVPVNLHSDDGKDWLEIVVEAYPSPISYKGEYHFRSGSTKQELKGAALEKFLLQKRGWRWDGVPVPGFRAENCSDAAFKLFKTKAVKSGRMSEEVLADDNDSLLENLELKEGSYLKRAATLLFFDQPEKFVSGAYIKIGFFVTDDDLRYQDEIHGNLFEQVERVLEILFSKYLKAYISYEGLQRIEAFLFPYPALREALLNAVVHKDYSSGIPIQISVYHDKIVLWSSGQLPQDWTLERLMGKHPSTPYNPLIANAFFRAGYIESWGRGIEKINRECREYDLAPPLYDYGMSGLMLTFHANPQHLIKALGEQDAKLLLGSDSQKTAVKTTVKTSVKTAVKTSVKTSVKTPEKILQLLEVNPAMTLAQVAAEIEKSLRAVELASSKLVKAGRLRYVGPQKGGHWEVLK